MKTQRFHHVIDFLFAAALFGVFLVSSVMVIAVGAGAYRNITEKSQEDYTLRTSLSYVNEKLRQRIPMARCLWERWGATLLSC